MNQTNFLRISLAILLFPASACGEPTPAASWKVVPAFPNLQFELPLYLAAPPDGSDRLFVAEQDGRVRWFKNRPDVKTTALALDISQKVRRVHNEEGLLGLAFHPRFKSNRQIFVQYSASRPRRNVISRFTMDAALERAETNSEKVILEIKQPYGNHNGGMLAFGPDGFLYISLGDGGGAGDPHENGQNKSVLLGKILRINVDHRENGRAYAVPPDNPFARTPGARGEIWAYGLRNMWRFSFDRKTNVLWGGDVGQDRWEEIDIVKKGLNYGWNRREGKHPFHDAGEGPFFEEPILDYGREEGQCVTGGYVYRGQRVPGLAGAYIYGDFMNGNVWMLRYDGNRVTEHALIGRGELISSFGEDENGEIYFTSFDGKIYTLEKAP